MPKKKKPIGLNGRLAIIAQAVVDYAEEGGAYSLEAVYSVEDKSASGVAVVLHDTQLILKRDADGVMAKPPLYELQHLSESE